jgi:hypothetical protein
MNIPLYPTTPPAKAPQAPSLDPGTRGFTVDLSAVAAAQEPALIDARGFIAQAGAAGYIGQALEKVADLGTKMAQEHFASENRTKVLDAEAALESATKQLAARVSTEKSTLKWKPIAEEEMDKWHEILLGDKTELSRSARADIEALFNRWKVNSLRDVQTKAMTTAFEREAHALNGRRLDAIAANDWNKAHESTNLALDRRLISHDTATQQDEDTKKAKDDAHLQAGFNARGRDQVQFGALLEKNPWRAGAALDAHAFKSFSDEESADARKLVKQAVEVKKSAGREELRQLITDNKPQATADGIRALAKQWHLDDKEVQGLLDYQQSLNKAKTSEAPFDWHEAAALQADIRAYDPENYAFRSDAAKAYGELVQRTEVLGATGQASGKITKAVLGAILYHKHPFQEHQVTDEETAHKGALEKSLDLYQDEGVFGPRTRQIRVKELTKENGEHEVEVFKEVPDADTARQRIRASQTLGPLFMKAVKDGTVDPSDIDSVDNWVRPKIKRQMQAAKIKQDAGSASGFGGLKAAAEVFRNIIK